MKAAAPRIMNTVSAHGVELQAHRPGQSFKIVGLLLLAGYFVTSLALYSVYMKFQIDYKFDQIQHSKKRMAALHVKLDKLEADVNQLSSFPRIEHVLAANKVSLVVPKDMVYVDVTGAEGRFASLPKASNGM